MGFHSIGFAYFSFILSQLTFLHKQQHEIHIWRDKIYLQHDYLLSIIEISFETFKESDSSWLFLLCIWYWILYYTQNPAATSVN